MRPRTVLLTAVALGAGYALWRLPVAQRFVATVREASARREAELREAVEVAVRTDATTRAPRHGAGDGGTVPVPTASPAAGPVALGEDDPGRSLTPDEARALLLDPSGDRAP